MPKKSPSSGMFGSLGELLRAKFPGGRLAQPQQETAKTGDSVRPANELGARPPASAPRTTAEAETSHQAKRVEPPQAPGSFAPVANHAQNEAKTPTSPTSPPPPQAPPSSASDRLAAELNANAVNVQRTLSGSRVSTCIGLDFGTSTTKVVVGLPTLKDSPMFPVRWRGGGQQNEPAEFLLPSEVWFDGRVFALKPTPTAFRYARLKQSLLGLGQGGSAPKGYPTRLEATVAFLALALRETRKWFLDGAYRNLGIHRLDWTLLVGIPAERADQFRQSELYRNTIQSAWLASVIPGEITPLSVQRALQYGREFAERPEDWGCTMDIVPEVAAEVFSYGSSPQRRDDVHLMVDVGAGTVDLCAFIFPPNQPSPHFLTAQVTQHGAQRLHDDRCGTLRRAATERLQHLEDSFDPLRPLPEHAGEFLPPEDTTRTLKGVDSRLSANLVKTVSGVIHALRRARDPNSPVWRGHLPTFLCGGGGLLPIYRSALNDASLEARRLVGDGRFLGFEIRALPCPDAVRKSIGEAGFHRLAVAWGLARRPENVGVILTPAQIEDIERFRTSSRSLNDYVGKEQV